MITFAFNPEKFVNAVAWFATQCPDCTKLKICKLLYYADKEHLLKYGRPIIGDHYYKLKNGPIPTIGLNMLRGQASPANKALFDESLEVRGWRVHAKRDPDMSVFSKSDINVLNQIRDTLGHLDPYQLRDKSHDEPWWDTTEMKKRIAFETIAADSEELREVLEEEQGVRNALRRYQAVV